MKLNWATKVQKWGNSLGIRISQQVAENLGFTIVCPIKSQVKGYPFEVELPVGLVLGHLDQSIKEFRLES